MHRPRARVLQQFAEQVAVEPCDGQPLRPARRPRNDIEVLSPQPAFADQTVGVATGKQGQGTHALNGSMPEAANESSAICHPEERGNTPSGGCMTSDLLEGGSRSTAGTATARRAGQDGAGYVEIRLSARGSPP